MSNAFFVSWHLVTTTDQDEQYQELYRGRGERGWFQLQSVAHCVASYGQLPLPLDPTNAAFVLCAIPRSQYIFLYPWISHELIPEFNNPHLG